jgi:hypothetical protein
MTKVLVTAELAKLCASVEKTIRDAVQSPRTCLTCDLFDEEREVCMHPQQANLRPPARIIAYGCIHHIDTDSDIPF